MFKKAKDIASNTVDTIKKTTSKAYHQVRGDNKCKVCDPRSTAVEAIQKAGELLEESGGKIKEMGKKL